MGAIGDKAWHNAISAVSIKFKAPLIVTIAKRDLSM